MITKFNQNPKNTVWMHENNIAHGSGNTLKRDLRTGYKYLSLNNIEEREPLKVKKMTNLTFKGFHLVSSRKILNILAEQFAPGQKISPKNAYKKIIEILPDINKDYEYLRLALEKSGDKITGDLVISEPVYSRFAKAVVAPAKALVSALKYPFLSKQAKEGLKNQKEIQQAASSLVGIYKKVTSMEGKSSNEIKKAISGFVNKQLNSLKTNYSINIASPIITLVAGGLSAWFLANDFSNMKRLATDDPVEAKKEWKSKFKQVTLGIGLASYLTYVTNTTFKKTVNSSLKFAVGLNAVNLAITEIISRKLTGRPVFLQRNPKSNETNSTINKYSGLLNNNGKSAFSAFITDKSPSSVTFTGSLLQKAITSTIPREKFVESMNLLKQVDRKRYIQVINTVKSEFLKSGIFKDQKVSLLKMLKDKNYLNNIAEIPIGKNNFYNSMVDLGKALTFPIKPIIILAKKALGKSNPSEKESLGPLFVKNTLEILNKAKQGVGNTLESIKTNYGSAIAKQLSSEKPTYGGEKASIFFKATGLVTVPFLVMEAWNMAKKETGDDDIANQKARERTAQDLTRQAFSTWVVAGINKSFKPIYNSSLLGAAIVTASSVLGYESATRLSVGVPITPKSKSEMLEIDKKNYNKKGLSAVFFRLMSRLTGKKPLSERTQKINKPEINHSQLQQSLLLDPQYNKISSFQPKMNNNVLISSNNPSSFNLNNSLVPDRLKTRLIK